MDEINWVSLNEFGKFSEICFVNKRLFELVTCYARDHNVTTELARHV